MLSYYFSNIFVTFSLEVPLFWTLACQAPDGERVFIYSNNENMRFIRFLLANHITYIFCCSNDNPEWTRILKSVFKYPWKNFYQKNKTIMLLLYIHGLCDNCSIIFWQTLIQLTTANVASNKSFSWKVPSFDVVRGFCPIGGSVF